MQYINPEPVVNDINQIIYRVTGQYIDPSLVDVVIAAKRMYERESPQELANILQNVCAEEEYGLSDMAYEVGGRDDIHELGDKVRFYKMAFIKGQFHPPSLVKQYVAETENCIECGVDTHCVTKMKDMQLCNHCASHNEVTRTMACGTKKCELCSKISCTHHPEHNIIRIGKHTG